MTLAETLGYRYALGYARGVIGMVQKHLGQYPRAEASFLVALDIFASIEMKNYLCEFHLELADCYVRMGEHQKAAELAAAVLTTAVELSKQQWIFDANLVLARVAAAGDRASGLRQLESMLSQQTDDGPCGRLHYELFRLTGERRHRDEGLAQLREPSHGRPPPPRSR